MLIQFAQNRDTIELSYVNSDNRISVEKIQLKYGYYDYKITDEFDDQKIPNKISFRKHHFKKVPANRFKKLMINEFINVDIPINYPDLNKKITELRIPDPYSVDIEVIPTEEFGYSDQYKVENPINSISITDKHLNTIVFVVKNPDYPVISDKDVTAIRSMIKNHLGKEFTDKYDFEVATRVFDTEKEMLLTFFETIKKYFNAMFGWNYISYDWTYITNRAEKLGISPKLASPTHKIKNKQVTISKSNNVKVNIKMPHHIIIKDYMVFFKESLIYSNLGCYSLDCISEMFLKLQKVSYTGNLRTLYKTDFVKFIFYNIIDTILPMLIHHKVGLYNVDFFESYLNRIPYLSISQNNISEALVYNQLKLENSFLLTEEFNDVEKQPYPGGYVKMPIKKVIRSVIGIDYSALYPYTMITYGLSPERYVDSIIINPETNRPLDDIQEQKWLYYKKQNCILVPTGRIYKRNNDDGIEEFGLYPKIELQKQKERGIFKSIKNEIYLDILTQIEKLEQKLKQ